MKTAFDNMLFFVRLRHWEYGTKEALFEHKHLAQKNNYVNQHLLDGWEVECEKLMNNPLKGKRRRFAKWLP